MIPALLATLTPVENYITIGGIIAPAATALGVVWLTVRLNRTDTRIKGVGAAADLAAERSTPTANGYTARTEAALARIERAIDATREEALHTNARLERLAKRFDSHIQERS